MKSHNPGHSNHMQLNGGRSYARALLLTLGIWGLLMAAIKVAGLLAFLLFNAEYIYPLPLAAQPGAPDQAIDALIADLRARHVDIEIIAQPVSGEAGQPYGCDGDLTKLTLRRKHGLISHLQFFRQLDIVAMNHGLYPCELAYEAHATDIKETWGVGAGHLLLALVLAAVFWRARDDARRRALWLHWTPRMGMGQAVVAGLLWAFVMAAVATILQWLLRVSPESYWEHMPTPEQVWLLLPVLLIAAPLVEEYAFRAWLLQRLDPLLGGLSALVVSSALFALLHLPDTIGIAAVYIVLGLLLGVLWLRTRSLPACVCAHAGYNAFFVLAASGV